MPVAAGGAAARHAARHGMSVLLAVLCACAVTTTARAELMAKVVDGRTENVTTTSTTTGTTTETAFTIVATARPTTTVTMTRIAIATTSTLTRAVTTGITTPVAIATTTLRTTTTIAAAMWVLESGPCTQAGPCIYSPNFPENYGSSQRCEIYVPPGVTKAISVAAFDTEADHDYLWVNGIGYSGRYRDTPAGVTPSSNITWSSDSSVAKSGWELCLGSTIVPPPRSVVDPADGSTTVDPADGASTTSIVATSPVVPPPFDAPADDPATTQAPPITPDDPDDDAATPSTTTTVAVAMWTLESGPCTQSGPCISSPNFPDVYGNHQSCEIEVPPGVTEAISVVAFDTEDGYDYLWVNGHGYSGADGPAGVTPTSSITWSSDSSVMKSGWKMCLGWAADGSSDIFSISGTRGVSDASDTLV